MKWSAWFLPSVAALSLGLFGFNSIRWFRLRQEIDRAEKRAPRQPVPIESSGTIGNPVWSETDVSRIARDAGVARLLGLSARDGASKPVSIEWEASQPATLRFLSIIERSGGICGDLTITAAPSSAGFLRARGSFGGTLQLSSSPIALGVENNRSARNVFAPLWRDAAEARRAREDRERKKIEEVRAAEQLKMESARRSQQEDLMIQTKKREIENRLSVTGIVNNGREALAFVSDSSGSTRMVRDGDSIGEARVNAIDERRGEVRLDYQGKFEVVLKLNSRGAIQ